jgi:hypothetical protein
MFAQECAADDFFIIVNARGFRDIYLTQIPVFSQPGSQYNETIFMEPAP